MYADKLKELLLILLLILATAALQGQQANMTEADVIQEASSLFEAENWQEALPLYAQLVSVHPENSEYNYKFGVCTLLGNRSDRRRPIRYLNMAYRSMGEETDLLYYLGLAYYQNQEFANAMKFMNLYLARLDANDPQRPRILEMVNASLNGMNLEHKNLVNEFVSTTEFQIDNFYRAYRADDFEGSLILKPDEFVSEQEIKKGEKSFVFVSEPRGILYFSGYGPDNPGQRDIFRVALKENGKWEKPVPVSNKINTNFDEAYPILTDGGQTLYFSSKGHNSMGGYDIFMSTLDPETKDFGTPENMGMGVNSPFDDILFIPEKNGSGAYFASNRDNLGDGINVFRVRINNQGFADQHMLAEQSIRTKLDQASGGSSPKNAVAANGTPAGNQNAASNKPLDPHQKGENLVLQRARMNKMADTAFLLVSNMKNLIRDLTNKRDRANMISSSKLDQAKKLEVEFEKIINNLPTAQDKEEFEEMLAQAVTYKEDIYQYRQRADQANLIAWNLGKQLKVKNAELNKLKLDAGEVQTLSLSGDYAQTNTIFTTVMETYATADTLTDYSQNINWINLDKITFDIPDTEIVFVGEMREAYDNQTLLAMTQASKVPEGTIDESVPIRVIDNRSNSAIPTKPAMEVVKQVEKVEMEWALNIPVEEETLELRYDVDAIDPATLVNPVMVAFQEPEMVEDELELRFGIDAAKALKLVEPVSFSAGTWAMMDELDIEVNFTVDRIDAAPIPEQVPFDENMYAIQMDDEMLEINSNIDWIEPEPLTEAIVFTAQDMMMDNEELEINLQMDAVQPVQLVEQISAPQESLAFVEEELLEIRNAVDAVEAFGLVEHVEFTEEPLAMEEEALDIHLEQDIIVTDPLIETIAYNVTEDFDFGEENLEVNVEPEVLVAEQVVETIAFNERDDLEIRNEDLDIRIEQDPIEIATLVAAVPFEPIASAGFAGEVDLEVNIEPEIVVATQVVETIAFNETDDLEIGNEDLDIRIEGDPIEIAPLVSAVPFEPIASAGFAGEVDLEVNIEPEIVVATQVVETIAFNETDDLEIGNEDLDIRIEGDPIEIAPLVSAVPFEPIASAGFAGEEDLEVNIEPEIVLAEQIVETIAFNETDDLEIGNEDLDIRIEHDPIEIAALVSAVPFYSGDAFMFAVEEELDVDFEIDRPEALIAEPVVEQVYFAQSDRDFQVEDDLELSFTVDVYERENLMADNASITSRDVTGIPEKPASGTELYYLRESVSMSANIETSRTDLELLSIAIKNPEDLSYEELLFAASIAPIPEDKLRIYNYAFIHIDRDWRAFNNAAVTSMRIKDLDQAEVYLYQASLISDENGKVENNKGILACYKNDFNSAENHFLAASQLGVNAEYNLQLIQQLIRTSGNNIQDMKGEMGKINRRK